MTDDSLSTGQRGIILFGSSGQIGSAIHRKITPDIPLRTLKWSNDLGVPAAVAKSLDPNAPYDLILACGITDPRAPEASIRYSNVEFPKKLIEACLGLPNVRFLTLGTVMEHFPEACASNAYLKSKLELGLWISSMSEKSEYAGRFRHIRLHTIYGGARSQIKPHMFLGQMIAALENKTEFRMSSGEQLREYHHVDDIADSILKILGQDWSESGALIGLHSGTPIQLANLAEAVFLELHQEDLLKIGSIPRAQGENLNQSFPRSGPAILAASRNPIRGVVQWIKELLETSRN